MSKSIHHLYYFTPHGIYATKIRKKNYSLSILFVFFQKQRNNIFIPLGIIYIPYKYPLIIWNVANYLERL